MDLCVRYPAKKLNYSSHVPQGRNFRDARPAADGLKNKISGVELRSSQITYWKIVNAWFFKLASCYLVHSAILSILTLYRINKTCFLGSFQAKNRVKLSQNQAVSLFFCKKANFLCTKKR